MKRSVLTIAETSRITGWNVKLVREAIKSGELPSIEIRNRAYVLTTPLEKLLQTEIPSDFFVKASEEA